MKKIISKKHAQKLISKGLATIESKLVPDWRGIVYVAVTRYDTQTTVHFIDR